MTAGKRLFDVCGAFGGILFFAPLMLAITAAILLDDGAPVLFRQARLGRGRRPFEILKFRSMRDGRITRVGRVLRATGLDELPQFLNILRGDLSAVGPRPVTAEDARRFGWTGPSAAPRWRMPPGLTGLGQLAGRSPAESLCLDRCYARRRSLGLDCRLVAASFVVNALGKARARRLLFARCPRQRVATSRLPPRASHLAPPASRFAPRTSRLPPHASRLAPRASDLPPRPVR